MLNRIVIGLVVGVLATVIFFNGAWALLQSGLGWLPAAAPKPWAYAPTVPPFGVPRMINLPFWGGVWGMVLSLVLARARGAAYWLGWTLLGAVALTLAGNFVVPLIKGQSVADVTNAFSALRFRNGLVLNGAWGLGAAILLRLSGQAPR
ncbi:MAG: hypothetical protein SFW09_07755 [Hyphomicrobiaceae bacterium]|nr:hypothetical protein [Hyphomicrobiaceae bacterium]